jgi:hypothetical protein
MPWKIGVFRMRYFVLILSVALLGMLGQSMLGQTQPRSYQTNFPATENPISENGNWISGGKTGLDWGDVQTTSGLAFGTNVSGAPPFNDSTAVVGGTWAADQMVQATVRSLNQTSAIQEEVELRLRTTITAHSITGYEVDFRATSDGSQYLALVRWNGPLNSFSFIVQCPSGGNCAGPGLHNGDIIKATIVGSTITGYINGVQVIQGKDTTFTAGSPGIGFWNLGGTTSDDSNYGFTKFLASDLGGNTPPQPPTNLHVTSEQ